jgi:hypothetical protein
MEVRFKLEKETKGALRYQEIDEKGEVIEQAWAKIGTLYIRKKRLRARYGVAAGAARDHRNQRRDRSTAACVSSSHPGQAHRLVPAQPN